MAFSESDTHRNLQDIYKEKPKEAFVELREIKEGYLEFQKEIYK